MEALVYRFWRQKSAPLILTSQWRHCSTIDNDSTDESKYGDEGTRGTGTHLKF